MPKKTITIADIVREFGECEIQDERGIFVPITENYKDSNSVFQNDLQIGEISQNKILDIIKKKYPKAYQQEGYFKEYDIMIPEINKTVEVKQDKKSNFTGNIVVEVEMPLGKPSALSVTKADFWVFDDGEYYMWWTPKALKELVKPLKSTVFTGRGDNTPKKAYLVRKHMIKNNALKIVKV